ncbi:MAG: hypothetical protein HC866_09755 [Leptolyngbyaceae cyanobacterium RU_5_1]|nr:hypothetical protein [Leptolyngbyaceae cyanobacterium RU_5_1]
MRQWAILVGIDDYQSFQSLSYAQRDAQALQQFLIREFEFPPEQCLLLTNTSLPVWDHPTQPTQETFQCWIERLIQNDLQPGDSLWFFFSGQGVSRHGQDYLVPIDGDPWAVETTCISVAELLKRFKSTLPAVNLLMLLDMSRSQGMLSYESAGVGIQTAQLASRLDVPTLLSCQPGQFSREVSGLGHGLFTVALLEGLRYQPDITLENLAQYLSDRLPELSEYYWQPSQRPVLICSPEKRHQPLLSDASSAQPQHPFSPNGLESSSWTGQTNPSLTRSPGASLSTGTEAVVSPASVTNPVPGQGNFYREELLQNGQYAGIAADGTERSPAINPFLQESSGNSSDYSPSRSFTAPTNSSPATGSVHSSYPSVQPDPAATPDHPSPSQVPPSAVSGETTEPQEPQTPDTNLWRPVLLWGGLLSLGLIGCVLWRNWSSLWPTPQPATQKPASTVSSPTRIPSAPTQPVNPPTVVAPSSPVSPAPTSTSSESAPVSAGASGVVNTTPVEQASSELGKIDQPESKALDFNPDIPQDAVTGQSTLNRARTLTRSDQATPYRDAIRAAKTIQPNDPDYPEAQREIAVWSQTIFNIAQQRANQGQWDIAVMAADMVPVDNPDLRSQAQAAIAEWCPVVFQMPVKTIAQSQARAICNQ